MYNRLLSPVPSNSFFLFGARGTGKTTFLKHFFEKKNTLWFDLLDLNLEDQLSKNPKILTEQIKIQPDNLDWVVIDEIQKIPKLLNLVHQLIESHSIKFALTGSSARKLKKGAANLLAGRAFVNHLFPLSSIELHNDFDLSNALNWGLLPKITQLSSDLEKAEFLRSYGLTYLKEEVWGEHLIKELDPFRNFLSIAAQSNTEIVNYSNIARDVGVNVRTIQSYFEILNDTLLGFFLEPYHQSVRKQQRNSPKFYFIDIGLARALAQRLNAPLLQNTYGFGKAFEHFIITEIYKLNHYLRKDYQLSYLQTKDHAEIDLIINRPTETQLLIEIKSSDYVDDRDTKTIKRFKNSFPNAEALLISRDQTKRLIDGIPALPWKEAIQNIFSLSAK